jgi:hypothetical protein
VTTAVSEVTLQSDRKRLKQSLSALLAVSAKYMEGSVLALRVDFDTGAVLVKLESQGCQLSESSLSGLSRLLSEAADLSLPYDAHLRLGLAWHLLNQMKGSLEARHADGTCTFTVTLPIT